MAPSELDAEPFVEGNNLSMYEDPLGMSLSPLPPTIAGTEPPIHDTSSVLVAQTSRGVVIPASSSYQGMNDNFAASPDAWDMTTLEHHSTSLMQSTQTFLPPSRTKVDKDEYSSAHHLDTYTRTNWQWPTGYESNEPMALNSTVHQNGFQSGTNLGIIENGRMLNPMSRVTELDSSQGTLCSGLQDMSFATIENFDPARWAYFDLA
jgi:hypothetical protein